MNRRDFIKTSGAVSGGLLLQSESRAVSDMRRRPVPSSGEHIPVVGLGTWQTFDVGSDPKARSTLAIVLNKLVTLGGSVVDSSPMYGTSESVVGELSEQMAMRDKLFMATKVWTSGRAAGIRQMEQSMQRMKTDTIDLMQVHNLLDAEVHLHSLAEWKEAGRIRYLGITHYHAGGYEEMMRLMRRYDLDFIQINYSMQDRSAAQEVLPLAKELGIATLVNRPFQEGRLFRRVKGKALPEWVNEFDCASWGQFFLKFLLANDAVTCVIPGTSKIKHMEDNVAAGTGSLPDKQMLSRMLAHFESL